MYTEYVFDNKKYDVACRDIKATLFEIVTTEEGNIAKLREKAFIDATDPKEAAELQNLYVQQDACLREILAIAEKLTKSLQRVDACSRKLKQIEDKNIAQIIANIRDINESQQLMAMQEQPIEMGNESQVGMMPTEANYGNANVNENGETYSGAADVAMAPEPVDEPVMVNQEEEVTATNEAVAEAPVEAETPSEEPAPEPVATSEVPAEASAVPETPVEPAAVSEETAEGPIPTIVDNSLNAVPQVETVETPAEAAPAASVEEPVITEASDVTSGVVVPTVTTTEPVVNQPEVPVANSEDVPMEPIIEDEPMELIPVEDENTSTPAEVAPVTETASSPLIIPTVTASSGETSSPLIIPTGDTIPVDNSVVETTSTPVIPTDAPIAEAATEAIPAAEAIPTEELPAIPVITISSDGPLEAVGGPLIASTGDTQVSTEMALPEIVPGTTVQGESETATVAETSIVFKKRTEDSPKVIMISKAQAAKLYQSLPTQEALISAKGYFATTASDQNLEQQLMNNGLLSTDVATKQAQIEQMMNQANELYAAGKVEEAQNMYNQISIMNKELQESAGIAK